MIVHIEECDDSNNDSGDGCSSSSQIESEFECEDSDCERKVYKVDKVIAYILGYLVHAALFLLAIASFLTKAKVCGSFWYIINGIQLL